MRTYTEERTEDFHERAVVMTVMCDCCGEMLDYNTTPDGRSAGRHYDEGQAMTTATALIPEFSFYDRVKTDNILHSPISEVHGYTMFDGVLYAYVTTDHYRYMAVRASDIVLGVRSVWEHTPHWREHLDNWRKHVHSTNNNN